MNIIDIDLDIREFKIKMGAEEMVLREPSVGQQFDFDASIRDIDASKPKDLFEAYKSYFLSLGGQAELIEKMSLRHLMQLMDALSGKKK